MFAQCSRRGGADLGCLDPSLELSERGFHQGQFWCDLLGRWQWREVQRAAQIIQLAQGIVAQPSVCCVPKYTRSFVHPGQEVFQVLERFERVSVVCFAARGALKQPCIRNMVSLIYTESNRRLTNEMS